MFLLAFLGLSLRECESILLDCTCSTQHSTVDVRSPIEKGQCAFQLSRDSQHPLLKATVIPCSTGWAFHRSPSGSGRSAPQSEKECMLALLTVQGIIFVIKIQNVFFGLKSKFLVEQHGGVACRDVKGYIFAHAGLAGEERKKKASQQENEKPLGKCGGEEIHQLWYLSY